MRWRAQFILKLIEKTVKPSPPDPYDDFAANDTKDHDQVSHISKVGRFLIVSSQCDDKCDPKEEHQHGLPQKVRLHKVVVPLLSSDSVRT